MVNLRTIKLPASANIKLALVMFALAIVAGTLYYTNRLANEMKASERKTVRFMANTYQTLASSAQTGNDLSGLLFEMTNTIDFPMIITGPDGDLLVTERPNGRASFSEWVRNVPFDSTASEAEQRRTLQDYVTDMGQTYSPLPIYSIDVKDSSVFMRIYYDDSRVVKQLQMLPMVGIIIISMFILVGYISFSYIKRNEQSNIWVGMAKETAHQLGTPLSSLLGWIELLRYDPTDTTQVLEAAGEMERDVQRLNKIAQRFSKIGSAAEVRPAELNGILRNIVAYFERRLPHLGKRVSLVLEESPRPVYVAVNVDLFEWVFENLVRNAADAIDHAEGTITMQVHEVRNTAVIDVVDNGRGIDPKIRKDIFRPGFSTKQRGWGLGLSLAKRIVEEYHRGKIMVKQSSPAGTTFRIRIPANPSPPTPAEEPAPQVGNAQPSTFKIEH